MKPKLQWQVFENVGVEYPPLKEVVEKINELQDAIEEVKAYLNI